MKKELACSLVFLGTVGTTGTASALTVYADFTGDGLRDVHHQVNAGDPFTASIYADVTIPPDPQALVAYGADVGYDAAYAHVTGVRNDGAVWVLEGVNGFDNTAGTASSNAASMNTQQGTIHLFDVHFVADAVGNFFLSLGESNPTNPAYDSFVGAGGHVYDASVNFLDSHVMVTPIPAAALLFGSGLLGVVAARGLGWRRNGPGLRVA